MNDEVLIDLGSVSEETKGSKGIQAEAENNERL